jgi:hypothetical protein
MICTEDEIENAITLTLGLSGKPAKSSRWADPVFHCTYALPQGPLNLTVTEFGSDQAARQDYDETKAQLVRDKTAVQTLEALGVPSYLAADDVVESVKESHVLRVDASALPATVGPQHRQRRDLAYLVTQAILRCWSGD